MKFEIWNLKLYLGVPREARVALSAATPHPRLKPYPSLWGLRYYRSREIP
jgi:hypothetical protein